MSEQQSQGKWSEQRLLVKWENDAFLWPIFYFIASSCPCWSTSTKVKTSLAPCKGTICKREGRGYIWQLEPRLMVCPLEQSLGCCKLVQSHSSENHAFPTGAEVTGPEGGLSRSAWRRHRGQICFTVGQGKMLRVPSKMFQGLRGPPWEPSKGQTLRALEQCDNPLMLLSFSWRNCRVPWHEEECPEDHHRGRLTQSITVSALGLAFRDQEKG